MGIEVRTLAEGAGVVAVVLMDGRGLALARGDDDNDAGDRALERARGGLHLPVSTTWLTPRRPTASESYQHYLEWHGLVGTGLGFVFGEVVRIGSPRHGEPPRRRWPAMVPTLAVAHELRRRMLDAGARGLIVRAAYRPDGGVRDSRHKQNAALDLDLMPGDERLGGAYLREAARIFRAIGRPMQLGVGTYHAEGTPWTRRVHIDAGTRQGGDCWQIAGVNADGDPIYVKPPAVLRLATTGNA